MSEINTSFVGSKALVEAARKFSITHLESLGYSNESLGSAGSHCSVNLVDQARCGIYYVGLGVVLVELRNTDTSIAESRTASDRCMIKQDGTSIKRSTEDVIEVDSEHAEQEFIDQVRKTLQALHTQLQATEFMKITDQE